jgi:calcineurin-like phosphoesterase family protein
MSLPSHDKSLKTSTSNLRFLHISDIHFKHFNGMDYLDRDVEIRNEFEIDLQNLVKEIGNIDALLVGGDVAFAGRQTEYDIADAWLKKICEYGGCDPSNVLTVPGNHDIDRDHICPVVTDIHDAFKALKKREQIDQKLQKYLQGSDPSSFLFKPLGAYLNFAQKFGTAPTSNPLYWEKDFPLEGYTLRVRGVNSAIVSNSGDNDTTSKLLLGTIQTQLLRQEKVLYLVLCHHPPDWLIDGEAAEKDFLAKAKLHLYGHKHTFKSNKVDETVKLSAGAMQPVRAEQDWEPRYNIIELSIDSGTEDSLVVKVWRRKWNKHNNTFQAHFTDGGEKSIIYKLAIEQVLKAALPVVPKNDVAKPIASDVQVNQPIAEATTESIEKIDPKKPDKLRKITYMFLGLPYHKKVDVANTLQLIEDSDAGLSELKKSELYITRAISQDKLAGLWDKIIEVQSEKNTEPNPFNT